MTVAMILCDADSQTLYVNSAARDLAQEAKGLVLRASERLVTASHVAEARQLADLIRDACHHDASGNIVLNDRDRRPTLIVLVRPVRATDRAPAVHALLSIRNMTAPPAFDASHLATLFKLSPAQAALAIALYEGRSFEDIALARNVKVTTLRTHFAEVLNRTGARGLRDLTRRLGMIPPMR